MACSTLRHIYVKYFRGTRAGNAARRVWYWDWRSSALSRTRMFPQSMRAAIQEGRLLSHRAAYVVRYYWPRLRVGASWLVTSRETSNFTYDLTPRNELHLSHLLAL